MPSRKLLNGTPITDDDPLQVQAIGTTGLPTALGQQAAAASTSVVLASDQGAVPVDSELPAAAALTGSYTAAVVTSVLAGLGHSYDSATATWVRNQIILHNADAHSAVERGLSVAGRNYLYNESSFDRQRGNTNITVLAGAARTATPTKVDQTNYNARSLILVINVTAATGSPSVVFTIQGKDAASGTYYTILASAAITGIGTTVLRVAPFFPADVANLVKIDAVPRTFAVDAVHANGDSITYSVGASLAL